MNAARKPRTSRGDAKPGGLPPDDDLDAFAAAVAAADASPARTTALAAVPPLTTQPRSDSAPAEAPSDTAAGTASPAAVAAGPAPADSFRPAQPPPVPAPAVTAPAATPAPALPAAAVTASAGEEDLPAVPVDQMIRQATVSVDATVAERFRRYQRRAASRGPALSNAEVIFRALDACAGRYTEVVAARVPKLPEGRRFGAAVPGRRPTSEARLTAQVNWRPTHGEIAEIRSIQRTSGAGSLSALINAVLDEYLPAR